jgi:hypothetical protein
MLVGLVNKKFLYANLLEFVLKNAELLFIPKS